MFLFVPIFSDSQDYTLNLADNLFDSVHYYDAITEYKRFIFFSKQINLSKIGYAHYKIGLAYRNQKLWEECIEAFQKSIQAEIQEDIKIERKISLAVALIASGNYDKAEFMLLRVETFCEIPQLRKKAAYFRGISALYTSKWKEATEAFNIYFNDTNNNSQKIAKQINSLLVKAQSSKYKSPKLAKTLSTILPGAGQIYAGDWLDGVNALIINTATVYLLYNNVHKQRYREAIFDSFFLFERFYSGNRLNAEKAAMKYNQNKKQKFAAQILQILKENQYDK